MTLADERTAELIRLLERDYDQTGEFIRSLVGTISTTRGWAVTVWLALLGVAIQQESPFLAALGTVAIFPFALLDAYHSWLYGQALGHARALERISSDYYRAVERGDHDEELVLDFETSMASHRLGFYSEFRRFSLPELRTARPRLVFEWFYPLLVVTAIVITLVIAAVNGSWSLC